MQFLCFLLEDLNTSSTSSTSSFVVIDEYGRGLHGHWHMHIFTGSSTGQTYTPSLWACSSICFCGGMHRNPNSTSFVIGFPVFSHGGATFTQSTCGHRGKQMWEPQEASLASQTFTAASRGDPVRHQRCRSSVNHPSSGFSCSSSPFLLHTTFLTLISNLFPPLLSQNSEVSEKDNWRCICFSCLSSSKWIWH